MSFLDAFLPGVFAATPGPEDPSWYGTVGQRSTSGVRVDESIARTLSAVFAASRLLMSSGSSLPLNLIEIDGKNRVIARDHPVHKLIHFAPNENMGSMMFRAFGIDQQVNWGNFYAEIVRDAQTGVPVAMFPIHASRVIGKLDRATKKLFYRVRNDDSTTTDFQTQEMFHVPSMVSDDGIFGKGIISCARESIGFGIAVERQGAAYFANSARPSIVIKGGDYKNDEAREYFRSQWMGVHGGAENNAKIVMLPSGADISILSFSPEDSQFLQTRQFNVTDIARWYGVPPHMIQDLSKSSFNNIEMQNTEFAVNSLLPWLKLWETEIWRKLLTPAERKTHTAKHNMAGLLRGDIKTRQAFYTGMFNIGVMSINDIRELEDMNPIGEAGDKHFVNGTYVPVEDAGSVLNEVGRKDNAQAMIESLWEQINGQSAAQNAAIRYENRQQAALTHSKIDEFGNATVSAINADWKVHLGPESKLDKRLGNIEQTIEALASEADTVTIDDNTRTAMLWLADSAGRMIRKETNDARRAIKKGSKEFFVWIDSYYGDFESKLSEAISKPATAAFIACDALARDYTGKSKELFLTAMECEQQEFETKALACADDQQKRITIFTELCNEILS